MPCLEVILRHRGFTKHVEIVVRTACMLRDMFMALFLPMPCFQVLLHTYLESPVLFVLESGMFTWPAAAS